MIVFVLLMSMEDIDYPANVVEVVVMLIATLKKLEDLARIVVKYIGWHGSGVVWREHDFDEFLEGGRSDCWLVDEVRK